jgi:hypothetical protein
MFCLPLIFITIVITDNQINFVQKPITIQQEKITSVDMYRLIRNIHYDIQKIKSKYPCLRNYKSNNFSRPGHVDYDVPIAENYNPFATRPCSPPQIRIDYTAIADYEKMKGTKFWSSFERVNETIFPGLGYRLFGVVYTWEKDDQECEKEIKEIVLRNCQKLQTELAKKK